MDPSSLTFDTEGMLSSAKSSRGTQNRDEIQSFFRKKKKKTH